MSNLSTAQQEQINQTVKQHAQTNLIILCQTCGQIFYIGTFQNYLETYEQGAPRDFHVSALEHAWNNPFHNVITQVPENDQHTELYEQILPNYIPSFTLQAHQIKTQCKNPNQPFQQYLTEKSIIKCSKCQTKHYGSDSLKKAVECCKTKK